ncbi:hypothetical protein [Curtobacterium sp. SORGH_AS_0776]|uniref:DUF7341 domain-containing protein n=1 Tax=Curtobacterium sp. SORGH_AS_0776 TaxID=3041798 RepID=UPI0028641F3A|nr:hypothetical protein [Curtobacterium sp. SORGH_AS_0776]MDR6172631.1 hypothetical protein [Curtobacterium sp. SORGH_AS_0776]
MSDTRLLDAVDALTKPTIDHVKQTTDDGEYLRTVPVEHPPLLQQLADAVVPSAGNDGGSKSASARERNVLDSDALYDLLLIQKQLIDMCAWVDVAANRSDLPATLRAWYAAYIGRAQFDAEGWYVSTLNKWAGQIRHRMERPKSFEAGYPCPICGPKPWIGTDGESYPNMLIVEYPRDEPDLSHARTICRNPECRAEWKGLGAIEELGDELREAVEKVSG